VLKGQALLQQGGRLGNQGELRSMGSSVCGRVAGAERCGLHTAWDANEKKFINLSKSEFTVDHIYVFKHLESPIC